MKRKAQVTEREKEKSEGEESLKGRGLEEVEMTFISKHGYLHFYEQDFFFIRVLNPGSMCLYYQSKANNTVGRSAIRIFTVFSQSTHIVVSSPLLIHGSLVSLIKFLGFYV